MLCKVDLLVQKNPMEQVKTKEIQTDVWEALNKLDEMHRTIIVLFHFSELTMKEIGQFLQLELNKGGLHNCRPPFVYNHYLRSGDY